MQYLISIALTLTALQISGCEVRDQLSEKIEARWLPTARRDSGGPDWKHLIENSELIAVGVVEETLYVQDPTKLFKNGNSNETGTNSNEAMAELPNLREAVKGVMLRFRVDSILHDSNRTEVSEVLNIYVKNGYAPPTNARVPQFVPLKKYLVFLSPLKKEDETRKGLVVQSLDLSNEGSRFDYKSTYKVTEQTDGYFLITDSNAHITEEVRQALADSRRSH